MDSKSVNFIVTSLAEHGELFGFLGKYGAFPDDIARNFYKQLLTGLGKLHENNIAHRDLKTENILLDGKFNLMITDLGFAGRVSGND